jgi:hypothetical protein
VRSWAGDLWDVGTATSTDAEAGMSKKRKRSMELTPEQVQQVADSLCYLDDLDLFYTGTTALHFRLKRLNAARRLSVNEKQLQWAIKAALAILEMK